MTTPRARAIAGETLAERDRQHAKWGEQNHPDGTGRYASPLSRLVHTFGGGNAFSSLTSADVLARAAKEATDVATSRGEITWKDVLLEEVLEALAEENPLRLRAELIQVAAVAEQWVEAIDRRHPPVTRGRRFGPVHARIVFLLSETSGATFTRLERLWAAKAARTGDLAWPFVSSSGLRTRVSELKAWGLVEWSGDWGTTVSNRPSRVWRLANLSAASVTQVPGYDREAPVALAALREEAGSDLYTFAVLESVAAAIGIRS